MSFEIQRLIVEKSALKEPLTEKILKRFSSLPVEYVDKAKSVKKGLKSSELLIAANKGSFVKKCPGTPKYGCCDYYVLNLGIGCFYNCTYCYLHYYVNSPYFVFVNIEKAIAEVKQLCNRNPGKIIRLGSGEFIDSIGFNEIIDFNKVLVPKLSKIGNLLFEIKTKSSDVKSLLSLEHRGKVVVSFSVNSDEIANKEEKEADSLQKRIEAARLCQEAGYKIGFHFDPLIYYEGWQEGYRQVVDMIFKHIEPKNIAWISLGALRFNKALKPVIQEKFPNSKIIYSELVPGIDNKLRYFIAIRKKLFKTLVENIKTHTKQVPVYLCMENKDLADEVGAIAGFSLN
ncbi:MAG: radical SAM protein [Actinobacteria bacterium]|nr:MAG: radical SAM protein [Actinomycetota bacterium]